MKNSFAQLQLFAARFDRRYIQFAYFVLMLAAFVITRVPSDGSGGTI